jgi:hypothetical protein
MERWQSSWLGCKASGKDINVEVASLRNLRSRLGVQGELKINTSKFVTGRNRSLRLQFGNTILYVKNRFVIR